MAKPFYEFALIIYSAFVFEIVPRRARRDTASTNVFILRLSEQLFVRLSWQTRFR